MWSLGSCPWLPAWEPPRPLASKAQLPARCLRICSSARSGSELLCGNPSSCHQPTGTQSWENPQAPHPPARPGWEGLSCCRGQVVVYCALWGRLVCNTGKMKPARLLTGFLPAGDPPWVRFIGQEPASPCLCSDSAS